MIIIINRFFKLVETDNVLFRQAEQARRLPNIVLATIMHLAFISVGLGIVLVILFLFLSDWTLAQEAIQGSGGMIGAFSGMVAALWVWMRCFEKRPLRSAGLVGARILSKYLLGFGFGALMIVVVVGLMSLSGNLTTDSGGTNPVGSTTALGATLLMLIASVVQGGSEEIITRGWYLGTLGARYRPWVGVAVSSLLFSALHFTANPVALLNLLLFGLFLALYCLREGSIWGVCGWHTAWNWTMAKFFGLSVSGHDVSSGAFVNLRAEGNPYLSGGNFGPEGSIYATLIFFVGIAVVLMVTKTRKTITS